MIEVRWGKDERAESNMKLLGVKWTVETVRIDDIDLVESLRRQSRMSGKLDDDMLLRYGEAMEQGATFPRTILNKSGKVYFVVGGNHRINAAHDLLKQKTVEAYIVMLTDPSMFDMLPRLTNMWEGVGLSKEERLLTAEHFMIEHSLDAKRAAKMCLLKPEHLNQHVKANGAKKEFNDAGIKTEGIPKTLMLQIAAIPVATVRRSVAACIAVHKTMSFAEKQQLIDDVKRKQESEANAISEVDKWRDILGQRERKKQKKPFEAKVRDSFIRQLQGLNKVLLDHGCTVTKLQLSDTDLDMAVELAGSVREALQSLVKDVTKVQRRDS